MKKVWLMLALLMGQWAGAQTEGVHTIPEFTFESGKKLASMKVGYVTHGTLNADKSNAILVTHGTSGNRLGYNIYIGPGKAFDTQKYFVIAVDAIGGGNSSSPQNTGLGIDFPRYTIRDMVKAFEHLKQVLMGVMLEPRTSKRPLFAKIFQPTIDALSDTDMNTRLDFLHIDFIVRRCNHMVVEWSKLYTNENNEHLPYEEFVPGAKRSGAYNTGQ